MKLTIITTIVFLFILMGVSDALKDDGKKTFSKILEVIYLGILFIAPALILNYDLLSKISILHIIISLCLMRQPLVNVTYGIVRKGIKWYYIGTTAKISDGSLNLLFGKNKPEDNKLFLGLFYLIEFMIGIFVMYRNALIL